MNNIELYAHAVRMIGYGLAGGALVALLALLRGR